MKTLLTDAALMPVLSLVKYLARCARGAIGMGKELCMFDLSGKTLIVTGAGSGLGRELALQLAVKGVRVAACDIRGDALEETRSMCAKPEMMRNYVLDVADPGKTSAFPAAVRSDMGALHGIINNAGIIQPFVRFAQLSPAAVDRVMNINFLGALNLTRAVLPLLDMDTDNFIVNVSSMGGFLPVPGQSVYGASKAALRLFTEALYGEFKGTRLHVSIVFPGAMATGIAKNSLEDQPGMQLDEKSGIKIKMTSAPVAAGRLIEGMEAGKLRIFVGKDARMMDRLYRLMPVKAINLMAGRIKGMLDKVGA
ncbi:MAG: SDR family oxidoreductase [Clostridia bacterium]|nr:SDR family oxidoreductase [Clostridia bacterium]